MEYILDDFQIIKMNIDNQFHKLSIFLIRKFD